jgi:hypothetical protein
MVITSEQSHARWLARQKEIRVAKRKIKNEVQNYACHHKLSTSLPNSYFMNKMMLQNKSQMELTYIIVELRDFMYDTLDKKIKNMKRKLNSLLKQRELLEDDMYMISHYSDFKYGKYYRLRFGDDLKEHDILNNTEKYQDLKSKL